MENTATHQMWEAIKIWMVKLDGYPGWKEWRHKRITHTLYFDDAFSSSSRDSLTEFRFSDEIERQHAVILGYLGLSETLEALKDCEYYFRRYPFRGTPVSKSAHIKNVCEMYFGRFYEFRERLKKYLNLVKALAKSTNFDVGLFVKAFDRIFDQELRARHRVHHHERFDDIAIDRVFITDVVSKDRAEGVDGWERQHRAAYRKLSTEWGLRVRRRSQTLGTFLETVAKATLSNCDFLTELNAEKSPSSAIDSAD